ncbi:hypothetical protein KMW28_14750 [Flammeovirga yaeyamensis]|uniref:Uncharacterized protein n=1 Tax=Flammeovirga yaeyamensis TaxID=367791 RepID=A0AAX1N3E7_9BACT|nr:hypothetical protein [Flammeovirga yaeyamensis]MBB3700148.1 hypothetical protein [Flammeovirga yaeyamensis]NMF37222.1 hypothetical protein [Flammeovirga yaeyamensis]QWG00911.1 hypothetical protein KMW28_14750 [Flammeovirga yaeyamensis]
MKNKRKNTTYRYQSLFEIAQKNFTKVEKEEFQKTYQSILKQIEICS